MGILVRQSAGNAFSTYLGVAIGAVNTVILYPRVFVENPDYYGLVQLILSWALVVSTFTNLGIPNIILRYFPELKSSDQRSFMSFMLIYPLPVLLLIFSGLVFFQEDLIWRLNADALFLEYWVYIIPLSLLNIYFEVCSGVSQLYLKTTLPVFLKEVVRKIIVSLLLGLFWLEYIDIFGFLLWYSVGLACQNVYLVYYLFSRGYLELRYPRRISGQRSMIIYGLFMTATSGAGYLINRIDSLMIGMYIDLESVAYYGVAYFIGSVLNVPGKSVLTATRPVIAKNFANNNLEAVHRVYKEAALNLMWIGLLMFCLLWLNINDILFLLPENYREGKWVVFIIALTQLLNISFGQNGLIIANSKYFRVNLYSLFVLIFLTVFLNTALIPNFGMEGAAIATLIAVSVNNLFKSWFIKWKYNFTPFDTNMIKLGGIGLLVYGVGYLVDFFSNPILNIITRSIVITIVFIILVYFLNASPLLKNIMNKILSKLKTFR